MRTTLKQTLAGAWMLLAALALSTAGCSQLEDAPDTGNRPGIATGNEPISISIAPKPGFEAGDAETRSTVGSDGAFAWQDTDLILVSLTFDDHQTNPTVLYQRWVKSSTATTPVAGWTVYGSWKYDDLTALTTMNWPVGASKCKVQAFYTNCSKGYAIDGSGLINLGYDGTTGRGDHMFFTGDFTVGTPLAIAFKHSTTRVTFTGLKASTKYRLLVNGVEPTFATSFKKEGFALADATTQTFTTAASGTTGDTSFTICLPLTPAAAANTTIGIAAGEVKLTLLKVNADGTTTTPINEAILKATGSTPNWVMNGNRYAVNVKEYAGGIDPDTDGNLLPEPGPVVEGTTVHEISGYYITQTEPDSEITKYFTQTAAMQVCKDLGKGWYLPSMKDYETMMGWGTINPFTGNNDETTYKMGTDYTIMKPAFSLKPSTMSYFWSSTLNTKVNGEAWIIGIGDGADGKGDGNYLSLGVSDDYLVESVRCVQRKP